MGSQTLFNNTTGNNNVALGFVALYNSTALNFQVAIGDSALYNNNGGGGLNTAIGHMALYSNTTGANNTGLGYYAYPISASLTNWTGIGYQVGSSTSANNMVELGNSSVTTIRGQVNLSLYSDERVKDNITENVPGLDFIKQLRPVTYNYNIHKENEIMYAGKKPDPDFEGKYDIEKIRMTGFIAQEVDRAAKASSFDFSGVVKPANNNDLYSLRYSDFVVPLVKGMQEQQKMIDDQKATILKLQQQINEGNANQQRQMDELQREIERLKNKH